MLEDAYADVNGIRLHYVTAGRPEQRPLVVFLHGFPEFWYAWKDQVASFGVDYHAVAPDMRGYNLSSKPDAVEQYRVRHVVEDVRQLVTRLGHDRFILVGHDWGGAVAWAFALAHPEMLDGLVVVNAPHPGVFARELRDNPAQQRASQYMLMFRGPDAETTLAADDYATLFGLMVGWGEHREWMAPEDRAAYRDAWSQPGALTGGLNYYRASGLGPPSGDTDRASAPTFDPNALIVRVPTLVIWGERDSALLASNLDGLDRVVPDLTVKRIPDGSHWVVHERPDLVDGYIRDFVDERG